MSDMAFWSAHTHTAFSSKDALPSPQAVINRAVELNYPAIGLTDHGTMGGIAQGYKASRKAGISFLPGIESYVAIDRMVSRPATMHLGLLATNSHGYRNLVGLNNLAQRNFKYKPVLDLADLAQAAEDGRTEGIAVMTGCWFGLAATLLRGEAPGSVKNIISSLAGWFGSGCYVEIQNHMINDDEHDDWRHSALLQNIADSMGLPVVITQDSHYCHSEDRPAHETMKRLVSWSNDPDDAVFPGDGYHMVDSNWMEEHHSIRTFNAGMEGLEDLLNKAKVRIPELDTFKAAIPDVTPGANPDDALRKAAADGLAKKVTNGSLTATKAKSYAKRVDRELEVVCNAGFAGYLLFTAKVCKWIRKEGIAYNIRGSASGSMLCWLLDITRLDPIQWKLPFERFLSTDQASMPDIDIDVEDVRRDEVMAMLDSQYTTYRIGTWLEMGLNAQDDTKGSLIVKWKQKARKTGADPYAPIPDVEMGKLRELAAHRPYSGQGIHAAGVVVAPDEASLSGLPLTWIPSSKQLVSAFPMKDVESMGLVKLDILGLKTLSALREMQDLTGIEPFSVPLDDKNVFKMIAKGDVAGVFQLEGSAAARNIRDVRVTKMADIIASVALFRPAVMQSGATRSYLDRKAGIEQIVQRHPIIMAETKDTAGILIYQEQAMNILRNFGLPIEYIEKARKAIKASNANVGDAAMVMYEVIGKVKENAIDLSEEDEDWLEEVLQAYAGYSFNRAHATAYGQVAYITAWFKYHHPVAFWTAQINAYIGDDQEVMYLRAARKQGVSIRPPHVNKSNRFYTPDFKSNAIRKGLTSIKGIGPKAAVELSEKAPFISLVDLASRVNASAVTGAALLRKGHSPGACGGVIAHLEEAQALLDIPKEMEFAK